VTAAIDGLQRWLDEHDYESAAQLRGSMSHATSAEPGAFERAQYVKVLHSWTAPHELTPSSPSG
jgi:dihydroorotate dehydrogenase (fumarate)